MTRRTRLLQWAPWRRAPLLAFRSPALFAGLGVAGIVLGLAAGSRPVFVSSATSGALHQDLVAGCPYDVGLRVVRQAALPGVTPPPPGGIDLAASTTALATSLRGTPHLGSAVTTLFGGRADVVTTHAGLPQEITLIARSGAAPAHIHVLSRVATAGIWLPDTTANQVHAGAGDHLALRIGATTVAVTVQGVFRDLLVERDQFWCSLQPQIEVFGNNATPPVAVMDQAALVAVLRQAAATSTTAWVEYPPTSAAWTISAARTAQSRLGAAAAAAQDPNSALGQVLGDGPVHLDLPASIAHAERTSAAVASAVGPVGLASVAVAILVIIAATGTWLERRRVELRMLAVRGAAPWALAAKAVLELSVPTVAGAATGLAVAITTVRAFGPSPATESSAVVVACVSALIATAVGLGVGAVVVATRVRHLDVRAGVLGEKERLPLWELIVAALAAAAYYELRTRGSAVVASATAPRVDGLVLLFPVLMLACSAGLIARLLLSRRLLDAAARHLPTSLWLAARRLAAGRWRAAPMVTAAAVSIGIVMFGASLAASLRATVGAKATLAPGAAQVFNLRTAVGVPAGDPAAGHATLVTVTGEDITTEGHVAAAVIGVDPATFARAAFWESSFASQSLPALLRRLAAGPVGGRVPVITVGRAVPDELTIALSGDKGSVSLPAQVVARVTAFPGQQTGRSLLVVDRSVLAGVGVRSAPQIWVNSTDAGLSGRLALAGLPINATSRAAAAVAGSSLQPQLWALDYLQLIGLAAGAVTVCGIGLYFAANSRRRRLGTAVALRLGITARSARRATLAEVTALLASGVVAGVTLAWVAVVLIFSQLDPLPNSPPAPLFRFDAAAAVACVAGAALAAIALSAVVERSSRARSLPELLRDAR